MLHFCCSIDEDFRRIAGNRVKYQEGGVTLMKRVLSYSVVLAVLLIVQTILGRVLTGSLSVLTYPGTIIPYIVAIGLYYYWLSREEGIISNRSRIRSGFSMIVYGSLLFAFFILMIGLIYMQESAGPALMMAGFTLGLSILIGFLWVVLISFLYSYLSTRRRSPERTC